MNNLHVLIEDFNRECIEAEKVFGTFSEKEGDSALLGYCVGYVNHLLLLRELNNPSTFYTPRGLFHEMQKALHEIK